MKRFLIPFLLNWALLGPLFATKSIAADQLALGSGRARAGAYVQVPVKLIDRLGTPLGVDVGAGSQIQALAFQISWSPPNAILAATTSRAGATLERSPLFEHSTYLSSVAGYLASYSEATQPISGLSPNGAEVARVRLLLSPKVKPGTRIRLDFVPEKTLISNQDGSVAERQNDGTLSLQGVQLKVNKAAPLPVLFIKALEPVLREGRDSLRFRIKSKIPVDRELKVRLSISGTATPVADYGKILRVFRMPAGRDSVLIKRTIKKDEMTEDEETVVLSLRPNRAYSVMEPNAATVTIVD